MCAFVVILFDSIILLHSAFNFFFSTLISLSSLSYMLYLNYLYIIIFAT